MTKTASALDMIKEAQKNEKVTIGYDSTLKAIKAGELSYAFAARNAANGAIEDLTYYAGLSDAKFSQLNIDSENLGITLRKQFTVSVVGIRK